jgi:hypothetical protein
LVSGSYDVVLDANGNGAFDEGIDRTDVVQVILSNVISEVSLGTVAVSLCRLAALAGFAGFKRFSLKFLL